MSKTRSEISRHHAETWAQIVDDCRNEMQSSINVGSNKRRSAILAVNAAMVGDNEQEGGAAE